MPKFNCTVTFGVSTEINFDGDVEYAMDTSEVEDFTDNSGFGWGNTVESDGGDVSFTVEAEDEDDADEKAREVVRDGAEIEDSSGITWIIENVDITVEKVEEPMTLERAIEILTAMADENDRLDDEQREAIHFVLNHVTKLTRDLEADRKAFANALQRIAALEAAQHATDTPIN